MQKQVQGLGFDHISYPSCTALRDGAGTEEARFQKPVVNESCRAGAANSRLIEWFKEVTLLP